MLFRSPLGRLNAHYTLYQNDTAKIKIPGITNITGLPAGSSFQILPNDTIQITTTDSYLGVVFTTATISGGSSSIRFEVFPAFETQTAAPQYKSFNENDMLVWSNANELTIKVQNNDLKDLELQVLCADGKLMFQKRFESNELKINTSTWMKGLYLIKITNKTTVNTRKIVVS